jgi:hypothetical protein
VSGPLAFDRPAIRGREGKEGVPADLYGDVRPGKQQRVRFESLRYRHSHEETDEHQGQEQKADSDGLRIQFVGGPGRVVP